jgi:hypothetical protein
MTNQAAARVDSLGLNALQGKEASAIKRAQARDDGRANSLWGLFRGKAIDRLVREQASKDPLTSGLQGLSNSGADFRDPKIPNLWWDMTTNSKREFAQHSEKYGGYGIHISTGETPPIPRGTE